MTKNASTYSSVARVVTWPILRTSELGKRGGHNSVPKRRPQHRRWVVVVSPINVHSRYSIKEQLLELIMKTIPSVPGGGSGKAKSTLEFYSVLESLFFDGFFIIQGHTTLSRGSCKTSAGKDHPLSHASFWTNRKFQTLNRERMFCFHWCLVRTLTCECEQPSAWRNVQDPAQVLLGTRRNQDSPLGQVLRQEAAAGGRIILICAVES